MRFESTPKAIAMRSSSVTFVAVKVADPKGLMDVYPMSPEACA
jgi:hypothetical protein